MVIPNAEKEKESRRAAHHRQRFGARFGKLHAAAALIGPSYKPVGQALTGAGASRRHPARRCADGQPLQEA
ncbi:MAG TPA: hypothetical protein VLA61_28655 [Ideonella sp.]|uniref:hypothetical protein n=1 Tax=Ideonella sp. TaxID=1929293 RepID=UPI002C5189B8|nr:hypothetical protein [Ideonella sp.]HSI52256.1 hypothetical protein [Ideonella sp.]